MSVVPILKSVEHVRAYRISPDDTNYFALLLDPQDDDVPFVSVVEIFNVRGKTPPNVHARAHEMFYVLKGEGIARCDGTEARVAQGDVLLLPPGGMHVVENTGTGKLYCLTTMVPNEDFAELIRAGEPVALDAEDIAVLTGRTPG